MKTVLITGSTDGIGRETAKLLVAQGHRVLLHGRTPAKLEAVQAELSQGGGAVEGYVADLSDLQAVSDLAGSIAAQHESLDALINNAGVYRVPNPRSASGLDLRFLVNTIAPYLLTQKLLPLLGTSGRVINLSSAAQAPVNLHALVGEGELSEGAAYAQSKLALTMWSRSLAASLPDGPAVVAVNPGSFLGSKMVKEAYGMAGKDLQIGARILERAALSDAFAKASGQYYDNDAGRFASPHSDALDPRKCAAVVKAIEGLLAG